MAKKEQTYEEALGRLESIVEGFEQGELGIDQLGERLAEAQSLLRFCKERLQKVETEVKKILGNEQE